MQAAVVKQVQPRVQDRPRLDSHAPGCPKGPRNHGGPAGESGRLCERQRWERVDPAPPRLPSVWAGGGGEAPGSRSRPKRGRGQWRMDATACRLYQCQFPKRPPLDIASCGCQCSELRKGDTFTPGCPAWLYPYCKGSAAEWSRQDSAGLFWIHSSECGPEVWKMGNSATAGEVVAICYMSTMKSTNDTAGRLSPFWAEHSLSSLKRDFEKRFFLMFFFYFLGNIDERWRRLWVKCTLLLFLIFIHLFQKTPHNLNVLKSLYSLVSGFYTN